MARYSGDTSSEAVARFARAMPRFVGSCTDVDTTEQAANMLLRMYRELEDVGLSRDESFLSFVETNSRIIARITSTARAPMACGEIFAAYVVLRTDDGMSMEEAREGLVELIQRLEKLPR